MHSFRPRSAAAPRSRPFSPARPRLSLVRNTQAALGVEVSAARIRMLWGALAADLPCSPQAHAEDVEAAIRRQLQAWGGWPSAVGLAIPALVDRQGCVQLCAALPGLNGWAPQHSLRDLGCPVRVLSHAESALAEETQDLAPEANAALVVADMAIDAALRLEGRPLRGASGWAGALGFFPQRVYGRLMRLDELAGGRCMADRLGVDKPGLIALARARDARALAVIAAGGEALGLALAGLLNLLNPQRLVLAGYAMDLHGYEDAARLALRRMAMPHLLAECELRRAGSAGDALALGALRAALSP